MDDKSPFQKSISDHDEFISYESPTCIDYFSLMDDFLDLESDCDAKVLNDYSADFEVKVNEMSKHVQRFRSLISNVPFASVILLWAKAVGKDKVFGKRHISMMHQLISNKLLEYKSPNGKALTLAELSFCSHVCPEFFDETLEKIRCFNKWSIHQREEFVSFLCNFISWLSKETYGDIQEIKDPDRELTRQRKLPFELYIKIIQMLDIRERALAKIFYFGGSRTFEEALSLKIEDVNFIKNRLAFSKEPVSYPKHLFQDIKDLIGSRKKGYVFVGRKGEKINHTVPYRALKTVVAKMDLDPGFTFREFMKNI